MKSYKKKKIKALIKDKWGWFLASGIFLIIGTVAMISGAIMTGFDFIKWLQTPYALTFFVLLALGVLVLIWLIITYKRTHLGD